MAVGLDADSHAADTRFMGQQTGGRGLAAHASRLPPVAQGSCCCRRGRSGEFMQKSVLLALAGVVVLAVILFFLSLVVLDFVGP